MNLRKVHEKGNGTIGVTLPIGACRRMGIVPGTYMMTECNDNKIILTPISPTRQDCKETGAATVPQGECANE